MGLFGGDSFLGSLLGEAHGSDIDDVPQASIGAQFQDIFLANYLFPQLFQYLEASSATGQGGMLSAITKSGEAMPTSFEDIDWTKLTSALPSLKAQQAEKNAANFQSTYDTFSKIPALADTFAKAGGDVDSTGALAKIFGDMSGSALGSAASSGFLTDPTKQANALGPLALQKYQMEQSIQQNAQAVALGLTGAQSLPGAGLFGMNMGGPSGWTPGVLNSAGLFGTSNLQASFGAAQLNTNSANQFAMSNTGLLGFSGGGGGSSSASDQTSGLLGLLYAACWVADELYGVGSEKAMCARLYATTHDSAFLRLYKRHGKAWAALLAEHAWAKPLVAPIWDRMVRLGAAMQREAVA